MANKKRNKQTQINRDKIQNMFLKTLDVLDARVNDPDAEIKDLTLMFKVLTDLGAMDDIIVQEHEEIMELAQKNNTFTVQFSRDAAEEKRKVGLQ